jgi:hypothetical protein
VDVEWPGAHTKEVLQRKQEACWRALSNVLLESAPGCCQIVLGRRNAAAQMICNSMPTGQNCVALGLIDLNEEDQPDVALENSMKATMVPDGSPLRSVCKLSLIRRFHCAKKYTGPNIDKLTRMFRHVN